MRVLSIVLFLTYLAGLSVASSMYWRRAEADPVAAYAAQHTQASPPTRGGTTQQDKKEAQEVVRLAYESARKACMDYPGSSQRVYVMIGNDTLEVVVRCDVVNAYFAGKIPRP